MNRKSRKLHAGIKLGCAFCAALGLFTASGTTESQEAKAAVSASQSGNESAVHLPSSFLGGVIEGFYGPSWNQSDTNQMLQFMEQHGMNTFLYAPKYDPYERAQWRSLYPTAPWRALSSIVKSAENHHQNFIYSISPGLDITYGSNRDRQAILQKIAQLRSIGVHTFLLSLDDITGVLKQDDIRRYHGDLGHAQSDFANAVYKAEHKIDSSFRLIMAQTVYFGTKNCSYWKSLKAYLVPQVDLIWTGSWVLTDTMTADQVKTVEGYMGHRVVIWDNYPVNDFTYVVAKKPELFLGPLTGRDPKLMQYVDGYLFNPMYQARASEIPLWTCADFIRDPFHYQPDKSLEQAVNAIGGSASSALRTLVQNASSRYYDHLQPKSLQTDINRFWTEDARAAGVTKTSLYGDFLVMSSVDQTLRSKLTDGQLYTEMAPWSKKVSLEGQAGVFAVQLLGKSKTSPVTARDKQKLQTFIGAINSDSHAVSGTVVKDFLNRVQRAVGR